MTINLHARSLLTLDDLAAAEIHYLLELALDLKVKKRQPRPGRLLTGKNVVLLFDKPSTRTRCAFEVAVHDENGHLTYLTDSHRGHKESLEDTARVLGHYYDGIGFRGYSHADIEVLAQHAGIPVWNGLTDEHHPTQVLADLMTLVEHANKPLHKIKLVYVGDVHNNVARSLMIGAVKMGMHFVGLAPRELWPGEHLINQLQSRAITTGARIQFEDNIAKAVNNADALYTDVWISMSQEFPVAKQLALLQAYQVNSRMLEATDNDKVLFMHCLPALHDNHTRLAKQLQQQYGLTALEVTDEVFRSRHAVVFSQAENRLHTIKALMVASIGKI